MLISVLLELFLSSKQLCFSGLFGIPYIVSLFIYPRIVNNKCDQRKNKVAILDCEVLCIVLCIGAWTVLCSSFMASIVHCLGWDINPLESVCMCHSVAHHESSSQFVPCCSGLALIHALVVKKSRWYACSLLFVSIFFVVGLMVRRCKAFSYWFLIYRSRAYCGHRITSARH